MKRNILMTLAALLLSAVTAKAQTYQQLWKNVEQAQEEDLPKTAIKHLVRIEQKAAKERQYGHLLKSTLLHARLEAEVAPDSLPSAVNRLEQQLEATRDVPLKAVYNTVLACVYGENRSTLDHASERQDFHRQQALANPAALAAVKTDSYVPFVIKGKDSETYFGDDLLSVVGRELATWQPLYDYYKTSGNRRAACLTGLKTAYSIDALDALLADYGDLPEAGDIAIRRYDAMSYRYSLDERMAYLRQSIERYGSWPRINELRNKESELTRPTFRVRMARQVVMPGEAQDITLHDIRNLESLTLTVYRTDLDGENDANPNSEKEWLEMKDRCTALPEYAQTLHFSGHKDYEYFADTLRLGALPIGVYVLEFSSPQAPPTRARYHVSGLRLIAQPLPGQKTRYVVVDVRTGHPVQQATLRLSYSQGWNKPDKTVELTCDAKGEAQGDNQPHEPYKVFAFTAADRACPSHGANGRYSFYQRQLGQRHLNLFTDRSIYRPGQTVHLSGIAWSDISITDNAALSGEHFALQLRDANHKVVAEQKATTDEYGHLSADFTLPTGGLNGRFTIQSERWGTSFSVEDYKRPTFQVEFPEYKEPYKGGDTLHIQGKALTYSGVAVQGATVRYTVKRRVAYWWLSYSSYWEQGYLGHSTVGTELHSATVKTSDDGLFDVEIPLTLPQSAGNMFYQFVVEADVTDTAGETHSGTMSLPLGTHPTALTCNLPRQVRRDQLPSVTFNRYNAAGQQIPGTVRYRIDGGQWKDAEANSQLQILNSQLNSGEHRLEASCGDDEADLRFVVFSLDDQKPATDTDDWFYVSDQQFPADGSPVTLQVGSSCDDTYIVYAIYADKALVESGSVIRHGDLINRKLTYKEEYGNGLLLTYAWVKDGKCYTHQQTIRRPMPDKKLRLQWQTFRDRLKPGQHEEWTLRITTPEGKPADASLMAVLYDKSLDQLLRHQWDFMPVGDVPLPSTHWVWQTWSGVALSTSKLMDSPLKVPELEFSSFDRSVFPDSRYVVLYRSGRKLMSARGSARMVESMPMAEPMMARVTEEANIVADADVEGVAQAQAVDSKEEEQQASEVTLRENLQETAFCYPSLTTAKDGSVALRFTLPESLTTWRLMGIANTRDMLYGSIEGETVAQKDIMVQPNMPRFLRVGDASQVSARISNTTDHSISGTARLQLIDPETEELVMQQEMDFTAAGGKTETVTFSVPCDGLTESLLVCKVMAVGDGFSDGEQHYLPVLPDRELVTRSVPFTQHYPGVKTIDLSALFPDQSTAANQLSPITQKRLTIEYTNNPAWMMIQSLPTVGKPMEHSAIDQAASYYSNRLGKALIDQNPKVKGVFEQWKREPAPQLSLQSALEKNQELKDLLLTETPWVSAAERESEQKQRLVDFFDENGMNSRLETAVGKLRKLQNSDGSFSWYEGMPGSVYITMAVEEMLVRLSTMTGDMDDIQDLKQQAFDYLGKEMVKLANEARKEKRQTLPTFTSLRWLYLCALDGQKLGRDVSNANKYFIKLMKKDIKRQTIYEKALSAIVLARNGEAKKAMKYVQSLKEYTVYTEEKGRYYDTPRAGYSWYDYKIPTEVAAIEAIMTITPGDEQTVDEMRRWLLQEKRTQVWDTPINSINAIFAFLNGRGNSLTTDQPMTVLAIDGNEVEASKATAGLGYVKTSIADPKGKTFTASKTSEGTSWGAVYAQFMQKTTEIETSESGISIKREILPSGIQSSTRGPQPPSPTTQLRVGDRVRVRITIDTSLDLDFVQLTDRRAACMEPVRQLSGYQNGAYVSPRDCTTNYFFYGLSKGKHVVETEYYIDRAGQYETGTCTIQCAYAPEYRATAPSTTLSVREE